MAETLPRCLRMAHALAAMIVNVLIIATVGSIIAAVPPVLLALVQLGPQAAILATPGFVVINIGIVNFVEPRVMGRGLGISTLAVFLSLLFWAGRQLNVGAIQYRERPIPLGLTRMRPSRMSRPQIGLTDQAGTPGRSPVRPHRACQ